MEYIAYLLKNAVFVLVAMRLVVVLVLLFAGYRTLQYFGWFKKAR